MGVTTETTKFEKILDCNANKMGINPLGHRPLLGYLLLKGFLMSHFFTIQHRLNPLSCKDYARQRTRAPRHDLLTQPRGDSNVLNHLWFLSVCKIMPG